MLISKIYSRIVSTTACAVVAAAIQFVTVAQVSADTAVKVADPAPYCVCYGALFGQKADGGLPLVALTDEEETNRLNTCKKNAKEQCNKMVMNIAQSSWKITFDVTVTVRCDRIYGEERVRCLQIKAAQTCYYQCIDQANYECASRFHVEGSTLPANLSTGLDCNAVIGH